MDYGAKGSEPLRQTLPRFQQAASHTAKLIKLLVSFAVLFLLACWVLWQNIFPAWHIILLTFIASLSVLMATLQSIAWIAQWRAQALQQALTVEISEPSTTPEPPLPTTQWQRYAIKGKLLASLVWSSLKKILPALSLVFFTSFALALVIYQWNLPLEESVAANVSNTNYQGVEQAAISSANNAPVVRLLFAVGLLVLAFALLVIERYYAANRTRELPEAMHLVCQLRVALTVTVMLSACVLLGSEQAENKALWLTTFPAIIGLLPAIIATEILLRWLLSFFSPPQQQEPKFHNESVIAALWQWPIQPFKQIQDELKQRFGIDLRQSWAFSFIRRALLPVASVLVSVAWLLSGLIEIPMDARGIYERFGKPIAVWQPGIHLGLPWPLGRVQLVENGVVHELTAASATDDVLPDSEEELSSAEGPAPASANRLWDASHLAEKSQIIASQVSTGDGSRQSFHIVNLDVRLMYRIGLSDEAALNARYNSDDIPLLIRSTANRIIVKYFASRTLEGVLGATRTEIAQDIGRLIQTDLESLNSGVEIMATVVEAIHPPAAAANAYHAVQAAQIQAQSIIARQRGNAAELVNVAELRAGMAVNNATAAARETLATAEAAERRFAAEQTAFAKGGKAFLYEQYLTQLAAGLSEAELILVDHRIPGASATLDLRDFSNSDAGPIALGR